MGRFSTVCVLLLAACGDNLDSDDGLGPAPVDEIEPSGNQTAFPRYMPMVCGSLTWTTNITGDLSMDVSVAPRPEGAIVLATPKAGGSLSGFVLDTRMHMTGENKIAIDGTYSAVTASLLGSRVVSTSIHDDAIMMYTLDDDLANPQYTTKILGRYVAEPAFFNTQADLVMPVAGDDGLWLHRFDDSFEPLDSKLVMTTAPATSLTAAQMGVATMIAWSTATDCYMMKTSTFSTGITAQVASACNSPRISVGNAGEAIMVFDTADGVRLMPIRNNLFGGDARLMRSGTSAPRTVFDGTNFWVSYLDERGDVIVGFLDKDYHLTTMSLGGPKPDPQAYELVLVDGMPWVFSLGAGGYSASRMCVEARY